MFGSLNPATAPGQLKDDVLLEAARDQLASQYDAREGGFGTAPKFPMPTTIERLLRHWAFTGRLLKKSGPKKDREALEMAMITLTHIARGGIYDHIGGGFARYSVDEKWLVPHFEKMLYLSLIHI